MTTIRLYDRGQLTETVEVADVAEAKRRLTAIAAEGQIKRAILAHVDDLTDEGGVIEGDDFRVVVA